MSQSGGCLSKAAADAIYVPQAVGNKGTVTVNATPDSAAVWGLVVDKTSSGDSTAAGMVFRVRGASLWDVGMDSLEREFVSVYDYDLTDNATFSSSGDVLRWAHGGIGILGPGVGSPAGSGWRLQVVSTGATDLATAGLIKIISRAGYLGDMHLLGHDDTLGDTWNIAKTGLAAFGTTSANVFSGDQRLIVAGGMGAYSNAAGKDAFVALDQAYGVNASTWLAGVDNASGTFYVKENATQNWPIQTQKGSINGGLLINQWGTAVSAAGKQLGFFGSAKMAAQQTGTPAAATDLASVIALANSLRSSLLAYNLVT